MGWTLPIAISLALIGCSEDPPRPKRHHPRPAVAQPEPAEAPHSETHDELVSRTRREAAERR
jgi:hypothetical protein